MVPQGSPKINENLKIDRIVDVFSAFLGDHSHTRMAYGAQHDVLLCETYAKPMR